MSLKLSKQRTITLTLETKHLFWPFMLLIQASLIYCIFLFGTCTEVNHSGALIQKYTELKSDPSDSDKIGTVYFGIVESSPGKMETVSITALTYHTAKPGTTLEWADRIPDHPFWGAFFVVAAIFIWPLIMFAVLIARI